MPSFDTVLETDLVEVKNAVENTAKEIGTRFDFKGTAASIELKEKDKEIILIGDGDFQLDQIDDILRNKLTKRGVDVRFLDMGKVAENRRRQGQAGHQGARRHRDRSRPRKSSSSSRTTR